MGVSFFTLINVLPDKELFWTSMDFTVAGIAYDSRKVQPGFIFVAIRGLSTDGHHYINEAIQSGAKGIICERLPDSKKHEIPLVVVPDTRKALALLAAQFYGHPANYLNLIGVTGTNGKTTVTHLLEAIFKAKGDTTGVIGTVGYKIKNKLLPAQYTTPESLDLEELLREMVAKKVNTVLMEVSSHAISLDRVYQLPFDVAVFTNLTQDHLDFHKTMESYWEAKSSWFHSLPSVLPLTVPPKKPVAVLNLDDPYGRELVCKLQVPVITYGSSPGADLQVKDIKLQKRNTRFTVIWKGEEDEIITPLLGEFNVYNSLAAMAVALSSSVPLSVIKRVLKSMKPVPGRFERVKFAKEFTVIVDYAHTPDGLANLLRSVRNIAKGKVITLFGCGGDRDRGKRPKMGFEAGKYSDIVIVTSDNPRSEDPVEIIKEIQPGIKESRFLGGKEKECIIEPDRRKAITKALAKAVRDDIVVIAGKGHETYQIFKDKTIHFDDREVVKEIMREWQREPLKVKDVVEITGGKLLVGDPETTIQSISTDTRTLKAGSMYVALEGERFDGHNFLRQAVRKKATAVLVKREKGCSLLVSCIGVEDTLTAYMKLANFHRQKLDLPVVAVTGSNGKTTTKELIAFLLAKKFIVLAARESFNNEIGVPKTILELEPKHDCLVLELAMRGKGQIKALADIALPNIGIITNIGEAHLEMLLSREAIMHAKGELLESLPPDGLAVLPAEDPWATHLAAKCKCRIVYYGVGDKLGGVNYAIAPIQTTQDGEMIRLLSPQGSLDCQVRFLGKHNLRNAAGAMAVAMEMGVSLEDTAAALSQFAGVPHRLKMCKRQDGVTILDDTYNASPASMREALRVLTSFPGARRKVAVLADMLELGQEGPNLHREIGKVAAQLQLDLLVTCGDLAKELGLGALESGMTYNRVKSINSIKESLKALPPLKEGDVILVKGSRKMRMDRLVELLLKVGAE